MKIDLEVDDAGNVTINGTPYVPAVALGANAPKLVTRRGIEVTLRKDPANLRGVIILVEDGTSNTNKFKPLTVRIAQGRTDWVIESKPVFSARVPGVTPQATRITVANADFVVDSGRVVKGRPGLVGRATIMPDGCYKHAPLEVDDDDDDDE
jgi:hypothetical protein